MEGFLDFRDYPEINFTGMADCYAMDSRVRFILWDWIRVDGVFQRKVAGTLTRPLAGLMEDQARSWTMMASTACEVVRAVAH